MGRLFCRRRNAAVSICCAAALLLSGIGAAFASGYEYRSNLTIVNRTSVDLHFDHDLSFVYSPTTWLHVNTGEFTKTAGPGDVPAGRSRNFDGSGSKNYLVMSLVFSGDRGLENVLRVRATAEKPECFEGRVSRVDASSGVFRVDIQTHVFHDYPGGKRSPSVDSSGVPQEDAKIFHTDGVVTITE